MPTSGTSDRLGVVLVEPMAVVRAGLRLQLSSDPRIRILAEAGSAEEALGQIRRIRHPPQLVVLVAIELAGEPDAFGLIRAIRETFPAVAVVAIGTDLDHTPAISRALFVGADGFINKNADEERLVAAVRRAAQHEIVLEGLPRGALNGMFEGYGARSMSALTRREREVLRAAAEGLTARQIARRLGVAERTVTTHLHHAYRKLGANGRVAALATASKLGLLDDLPAVPEEGATISVVAETA